MRHCVMAKLQGTISSPSISRKCSKARYTGKIILNDDSIFRNLIVLGFRNGPKEFKMLSTEVNEKYKGIFDVKNSIKVEGIEYKTKPKEGEEESIPKREAVVIQKHENLAYFNLQPLLMP